MNKVKESLRYIITRGLDIFFSIIGLLFLLPLFPFIALLIKIDSRGPVFYRCDRVGLNGNIFKMYKFRTMYETPVQLGACLSSRGDPRVTPVGRFLRRLKWNEFPQFINILKGEMTLIGPRPESPELAEAYPEAARKIFTVKPGLAGPNQIVGRNEEEFYPDGVDPVKYYIEHIMPPKLRIDLEYIDDQSLLRDFKYLFLAAMVTVTGAISGHNLKTNRSQILLFATDLGLCLFSFALAHHLRYSGLPDPWVDDQAFSRLLPWAVLVRMPFFIYFGFYRILIRHLSLYDIKQIFKGVAVGSLIFAGISFLSGFVKGQPGTNYARSVFIYDWSCLTILLIGYRAILKKFSLKFKVNHEGNNSYDNKRNVLIWGAGDAGELCLHYLRRQPEPVCEPIGFIDDDVKKRGMTLGGIKVLGNRHDLDILSQLYNIQGVFLAIHSAAGSEICDMLETCRNLDLQSYLFKISTVPFPKAHQDPISVGLNGQHNLENGRDYPRSTNDQGEVPCAYCNLSRR